MPMKISKSQKQILDFVAAYLSENDSSPSYREIASAVGFSSVASVAEHIDKLVALGALRRVPGSARSLELANYRYPETTNLFRDRLITATPEESKILLKAMKILGLDLPEK